ncbi:MarR family transcriptional regulator [Virgisporangium aliadipatigenens]|uniref:MarR family transcriptional regulator n=2 Tax=Virgisporangium aliadipatigenens TaxID=741659 RepID=A0A8J3YHC1_9ACTN|nr:MarR family transcriptional regulator [Virgisporangium aliadipatigenens]
MMVRQVTRRGPAAGPLAASLRDAIMRLNRRVRRSQPVGDLTVSQVSALNSLEMHGALSPRELAEIERVQPPSMTKIVGKLEERGLVQRTPHPTDGRQVILSCSEAGREMVRSHRRAKDAWLAGRLAELTAEEREVLRRAAELLERIVRS